MRFRRRFAEIGASRYESLITDATFDAQKPDWGPINARWEQLKAKAAADKLPLNAAIVRCFHCDTGVSGVQ